MTKHDRIMIVGFVSLGAPIVAIGAFIIFLFGLGGGGDDAKSLIGGMEESPNVRDEVGTRISGPKEATQEPGERMARFEGSLSAVVASVGPNATPDAPGGEAAH